jgi:hypothetical protein
MNRKVCLLLLTLIVGLCIAFVPGVPTAHAAAAPNKATVNFAPQAALGHRVPQAALGHR